MDEQQPTTEDAAPRAAAAPPAYRYVGNGDHLPGIPARDLTAEDLATLPQDEIEASGLYERVTP